MPDPAILDDLSKIIDSAMWAHAMGYSKAGRGLDAERGMDLSRTVQQREEGPTYDLEIGDHAARVAYQAAVTAVSRADVVLATLLAHDGVTFQPIVLRLDGYAFPSTFRRCAARVQWRLERIEGHDKELTKIRSSFDRVLRGLSKALDHGPTTVFTAHKERPCRTCGIRPRAKGLECKTCETWRYRHDGRTRPVTLDHDSVTEAKAAQVRRAARDEGWGVA